MSVFLSYSSKDKSFVRRLHESLVIAGLITFFDEKDIKVGDNIPVTIEHGIDKSTYLIYVLSSNSINSAWVRDELSMAKIKAKSQQDYKILPVLIEDLKLPTGIAHIRYANFIGWEQNERYYSGLEELLTGLDAKKQITAADEIIFAIQNYKFLLNLEKLLLQGIAQIDGMVTGYLEARAIFDTVLSHIDERDLDNLTRQASIDIGRLGITMFLEDLEGLLLSNLGQEKSKELHTAILGYNQINMIKRPESVSEQSHLTNVKHALRNIAFHLSPLIQNSTLELLSMVQNKPSVINQN